MNECFVTSFITSHVNSIGLFISHPTSIPTPTPTNTLPLNQLISEAGDLKAVTCRPPITINNPFGFLTYILWQQQQHAVTGYAARTVGSSAVRTVLIANRPAVLLYHIVLCEISRFRNLRLRFAQKIHWTIWKNLKCNFQFQFQFQTPATERQSSSKRVYHFS